MNFIVALTSSRRLCSSSAISTVVIGVFLPRHVHAKR